MTSDWLQLNGASLKIQMWCAPLSAWGCWLEAPSATTSITCYRWALCQWLIRAVGNVDPTICQIRWIYWDLLVLFGFHFFKEYAKFKIKWHKLMIQYLFQPHLSLKWPVSAPNYNVAKTEIVAVQYFLTSYQIQFLDFKSELKYEASTKTGREGWGKLKFCGYISHGVLNPNMRFLRVITVNVCRHLWRLWHGFGDAFQPQVLRILSELVELFWSDFDLSCSAMQQKMKSSPNRLTMQCVGVMGGGSVMA